jgi:hypothetical protein
MRGWIGMLLLCGLAGFPVPAAARDVHVAPGAEGAGANGDLTRPFPSVADAFAAGIAPGDRLLLAEGDYGAVRIAGIVAAPPVRVEPAPGAAAPPRLASLTVADAAGIEIAGLLVEGGSGGPHAALVTVEADARDILLDGLTVRSAAGHEGWSVAQWRELARAGVEIDGARVELRDSRIGGVRNGIIARGPDVRVIGNLVDGFSGDGMRGLGDGGLFEGNGVQNCVKVDGNHDDGFQSWSRGPDGKPGAGVVRGVTLRGNAFRSYADVPGPLTCQLMGISLFDGMYQDWLIEGNIVEVDALNGIVVLGGENVRVIGNLVRNRTPGADRIPQITVAAHKDGRPGGRNLISGNRAVLVNTGVRRKMSVDPRATVVRDNLRLAPAR